MTPLTHADLFESAEAEVTLTNAFDRPYENAVATARTCYSGTGIIATTQVSGDTLTDPEKRAAREAQRDRIAESIYQAGHHTTLQHATFQFAIANVSRQLIWSFLHAHPFYNSEQVSQRYVAVKPGTVAVPRLEGEARAVYLDCVARQTEDYRRLGELLTPHVAERYFGLFPGRRKHEAGRWKGAIQKRAQEIARYVLPVATFAYLYHTVSGVTLLRYHRLAAQYDAPAETRLLVQKMLDEVLRRDPLWAKVVEPMLALEDTPEAQFLAARAGAARASARFRSEFDEELHGLTSRLVSHKPENEALLADAVREVFGLPRDALSDDAAIRRALDPSENRLLGEALNLTTVSKLGRTLCHPSYTFRKKLSHTADSQDQRHRMVPASRPALPAYLDDQPDYVIPMLVRDVPEATAAYDESMARTWEAIHRLGALGVPDEWRAYLLPNAVSIRFTESADLQNLHHKMVSRLCYNAQEEIWQASVEEARAIREVNPRIGRYLLPPCGQRLLAGLTPYCPEGDRYCGVRVWRLDLDAYTRAL